METFSLQTMQKTALLVLLVLTVAAGIFFPLFVAWSVFAGGVVVLINLWFAQKGMMQMAEAVISATAKMDASRQKAVASGKQRGLLLKFWLRIGVTGIVLFVLIRWQMVDIFGLLVGLSTIFLTAMSLSLVVVVGYLVRQNRGGR